MQFQTSPKSENKHVFNVSIRGCASIDSLLKVVEGHFDTLTKQFTRKFKNLRRYLFTSICQFADSSSLTFQASAVLRATGAEPAALSKFGNRRPLWTPCLNFYVPNLILTQKTRSSTREARIRVPFFLSILEGEPSPKKETVKGQLLGNLEEELL